MSKQLIIFGSFFAPIHDDPWTQQVHNLSHEKNFQDQLKTLTKTCYAANSASRVLEHTGRIQKIINNYQFLNFSFNPVLLNHLKKEAPNVYQRIIDGDKESTAWNRGHGNAVAQPFYHSILPLCAEWEAKLLVEWGLESFADHFGRASEGFWLPEGGVSPQILDLLIEKGIQFLVLAPHQAEALSSVGTGEWSWIDEPLATGRPYRIQRPRGNLGVFFYNPQLSQQLPTLLKDSESLYQSIQQKGPEGGPLCVTYSPGELFGWNEPFGDMCLASLWERIQNRGEIQITNFGNALESFPPQLAVKLKKGDEEKGSSLACPSGVTHWLKPCTHPAHSRAANSTSWKTPLRSLLEKLRDTIKETAYAELADLCHGTPEEVLQDYIHVLGGGTTPEEFTKRHLRENLLPTGATALLFAVQSMMTVPRLFVSFAWEDGELCQEATLEALMFALKAIELIAPFTHDDLEQTLKNQMKGLYCQKLDKTGAQVYQQILLPRRRTSEFPAALFVLDAILRNGSSYAQAIGVYDLVSCTRRKTRHTELMVEFSGQIHLMNTGLLAPKAYEYLLIEDMQEGVSLYLRPLDSNHGLPQCFDLQTLPLGEREEIVDLMNNDLENTLAEETLNLLPKLKKAMVYSKLLGTRRPETIKSVLEVGLNRVFKDIIPLEERRITEAQFQELEASLSFAKDYGMKWNQQVLDQKFSQLVVMALHGQTSFEEEDTVKYMEKLLAFTRKWKIDADLTVPQALVFEAMRHKTAGDLQKMDLHQTETLSKIRSVVKLGTLLGINTDQMKEELFELT